MTDEIRAGSEQSYIEQRALAVCEALGAVHFPVHDQSVAQVHAALDRLWEIARDAADVLEEARRASVTGYRS